MLARNGGEPSKKSNSSVDDVAIVIPTLNEAAVKLKNKTNKTDRQRRSAAAAPYVREALADDVLGFLG